jgi:hypothetical protein
MMNDEANALTPAPETNALLAELRGLIVATLSRQLTEEFGRDSLIKQLSNQ